MTVAETESKIVNNLPQDKVDTNVSQQKPDTNLIQNETPNNNSTAQPGITEPVQEDPNWKAFREARKKDRAEKEAAERKAAEREAEVAALKAAMEAAFSKNQAPVNQNYQDPYYKPEESEDERIEKKVQAAIAAREAANERLRAEREHQEYPQKLSANYPDFYNTVSQENLDYLDYHFPEVSRPLQRLPDGFDRWSDIYKAVKKFVPNNMSAKKDALKAENNFNKPRSISSPTLSQSGEAITGVRLTEQKRADNWARMQKILKGIS